MTYRVDYTTQGFDKGALVPTIYSLSMLEEAYAEHADRDLMDWFRTWVSRTI